MLENFRGNINLMNILPRLIPTLLSLEEITGVEKGIKEEDDEFIPL
jgi:hypothetical protein